LVASFSVYRSLVAFDHARQRLLLIALAEPASRTAFEAAQATLDNLEAGLRRAPRVAAGGADLAIPETPFTDGARFESAVVRAKEFIAQGDVFQVVLSRKRRALGSPDAFAIYRALRTVNPSPYMYFLKEGERAVAGASPEMLVRVEAGRVETRPIAGTRPRGATPEADEALGRELLADPKERAEHLMLVDLGRNDLGRVSRFGSVKVPELMSLERYSHVMHIVSSVTGELAEGKDALDALQATFPAGTLSGAPKIRAMELIDELEDEARGLYGGALGYLDFTGNLDFCIAIRTVVAADGSATLQAGAGIVADSDPAAERRETEAKAGAMLEALRLSREIAAW
jgi:anthranilate synthase component 1